uniref:RING-type domain-containing protein n=1 Tax=Cyanistes caeruleus TaxID=156563 RepID=A0A8C0ZGX0_CYACU
FPSLTMCTLQLAVDREMATERDSNCPICQDSWKDVASALPCHHQFCQCISRYLWEVTSPFQV